MQPGAECPPEATKKQRIICRIYTKAVLRDLEEKEELYYELREFVLPVTGQIRDGQTNVFNF